MRWRSNPSGKYAQERLTRGTVTSIMCRAAYPSGCARCGAGAVFFRRFNTNRSRIEKNAPLPELPSAPTGTAREGNNVEGFKHVFPETWLGTRPKSGLDCLVSAKFAGRRKLAHTGEHFLAFEEPLLRSLALQGYLAHKKMPPYRTLQYDYA